MNEVQLFIDVFKEPCSIDDIFGGRGSYWFAAILFGRFIRQGAEIMYSRSDKHFGTRIGGKIYDITGDVTRKYKWEAWSCIDDEKLRKDVTREFIML